MQYKRPVWFLTGKAPRFESIRDLVKCFLGRVCPAVKRSRQQFDCQEQSWGIPDEFVAIQ